MILGSLLCSLSLVPRGEVSVGKFFHNDQKRGGWAFFKVGSEVFQLWGVQFLAGGWAGVWTKEGQGVIQFAPARADYCGYLGLGRGEGGLVLEHACFHSVDTFVERSLYWNCFRLYWEGQRGALWAHLSGAFYLNDKDNYWLSQGADYANDITLDMEYEPVPHAFLRFWNFTGIGLNYRRFHVGTELDAGVIFKNQDTRLRFFLGWRPYDRKCHRNVEAWLVGLRFGF